MQQLANRPWITAGVVLVGAGVIAVTPVAAPLPDFQALGVQLTAGKLTLDLVRHGQSVDNVEGILGTTPPGAALTDLGDQQAHDVAPVILAEFPGGIDGIYASELIRTQETAAPLAQLLGMDTQVLPGLNEIDAGVLDGAPLNTFTEIGYILPSLMWILGVYGVPELGSTLDPNGMAFEDRVNEAIQTIYNGSVSGNADMTDVAFSHAGTIATWTLMNVKNPDFSVVLKELIDTHSPLSNTGEVVIEGNPTDGWTLVSYDGQAVPQTPDLLTSLFVDWRDLNTAPQMASWHIWEALQGGDPATISAALQNGFDEVTAALARFPQAVIDSLTGALGDGTGVAGQSAAESVGDLVAPI
ncbi:MAG: histidine phosphatase family protein [Mycobacterium sp.]